jgi:hypothetical protein
MSGTREIASGGIVACKVAACLTTNNSGFFGDVEHMKISLSSRSLYFMGDEVAAIEWNKV